MDSWISRFVDQKPDSRKAYTTNVIRFALSLAILAAIGCTTQKDATIPISTTAYEHSDECINPMLESMSWSLIEGRVIEVTSARTFRLRTDAGTILNVSLPNVGEPVDPEALDFLRKMISGKRVSVTPNPSTAAQKDISGDVHEEQAGDISRQLLRAGAAAFVKAPAPSFRQPCHAQHRNPCADT